MKKEKRKILVLLSVLLILIGVFFVQAEIIKSSKASYETGESVSVSSIVSANDKLCRSISDSEVKLFIVENKDEWSGGEGLSDVRGESSDVPNAKFLPKKVWENIQPGSFDLVIDCNNNNNFDLGEPLFNEGFTIVPKKGVGKIEEGSLLVKDLSWKYDSEEPVMEIILTQFKLVASNENIKFENLTVQFVNSPDIESLEFYADKNGNQILDSEDIKIGEFIPLRPIRNNQKEILPIGYTLSSDIPENFLIVYKMKINSSEGESSLNFVSLSGVGESSQRKITIGNFPFSSGKLEILPEKTCFGSLSLLLIPSSLYEEESFTIKSSGLNGCEGEEILIKNNECSLTGGKVGFCRVVGEGCEISSKSVKSQTYFACIDKNGDKDYLDSGESSSADLEVKVKEDSVNKINIGNESSDEGTSENQEDSGKESLSTPITGSVVDNGLGGELQGLFGVSNSFFVLLEATLLLILFVLIMILFKLKSPSSDVVERVEEEEIEKEVKSPKEKSSKKSSEER